MTAAGALPRARARGGTLAVLAVCALIAPMATGCEPTSVQSTDAGTTDAGTSPNASILPVPLATEAPDTFDAGADAAVQAKLADSAGRMVADASAPPPEPLRPDRPLPPEAASSKEVGGLSLEGVWRWRDVPGPPKAPEVSVEGLREAQRVTGLGWKIDVTDTGRMRIEFASRALPLAERAEIRARSDRYGAMVLWPNSTEYRVLAPGALRTVLGERRVDVTPLTSAAALPQGEGRRFGIPTRKIELGSSVGALKLELAKASEAGDGGPLLCRALVELVAIDPKVPACQSGEVPVSATYVWHNGGGVSFEVTSLVRRSDLAASTFLIPPPGAKYAVAGLPEAPSGIFLSRDELAAMRTSPLVLPPPTDKGVPGDGFVVVNQGDIAMYFLLDGIPVVAVPPGAERYVVGSPRGRYVAQWRTFFGDRVVPAYPLEIPARVTYGSVDAGAPDGG
jgi:hypothetical protein